MNLRIHDQILCCSSFRTSYLDLDRYFPWPLQQLLALRIFEHNDTGLMQGNSPNYSVSKLSEQVPGFRAQKRHRTERGELGLT
ncbi:hypothetical protein KC19_5G025900 [Ceratodon purpureus]|uniref:Uncharacterized protein n=1 Tax=Ceratodon purpureus TaxID=3225 RepID=A0A8T0HYM2_CERPU|nr:hypothetical protein KC19_5G025900 [Ceratodon purpureus]